jgi:outer membrane biosynthesis protein TonB
MYALSWIFLAAAIGSLAYGLSQEGLTFIYVSIGASVVAMLFLLAGVLRRRPVRPATAGAPYGPPPGEAARPEPARVTARAEAPARAERPTKAPATRPQRKPAATRPRTPAPSERPEAAPAPTAKPAGKKTAAKKTAAKKPAAKKPAAKKPAAKKPAAKKTAAVSRSSTAQVVALPERGTFHLSDCRIVKGRKDTETITKTTAKRRGYSACGICKPA